jgi:hypothetical protein
MTTIAILSLIMCRGVTTAGSATPCGKVTQCRMTLTALCPAADVMTRIYPEPIGVVIHCVRSPDARAVTHGAVVREHLCHMVLTRRLLKLGHMTLITVNIRKLIIAARMACSASLTGMSACQ